MRRRRVAATLLGLGISCILLGGYVDHRAGQAGAAETGGKITEKRARQDGDLWYVDLGYEYRVEGESYRRQETRIIRGKVRDEAEALARAGESAVGDRVPVYFDPERPHRGVLERAGGHHGLLFAVGALWFALGTLWMAYDRGRTA